MKKHAGKIWGIVVSLALLAGVSFLLIPSPKCSQLVVKGSETPPNTQVAVVVAPTSSFVDFDTVLDQTVNDIKRDLGAEQSDENLGLTVGNELTTIVADGAPQLITKTSVDPISTDNPEDIRQALDGAMKPLNSVAGCAGGDLKLAEGGLSTVEESDPLRALTIASDQMSESATEHIIYLIGNGIQTTGAIRMQDEGSFPKTDKIAKSLAKSLWKLGELPEDLKGAEVHLIGVGLTNKEYEIPASARKSLIVFWKEVIRLSNGSLAEADIVPNPGGGEPSKAAIAMSAVKVEVCRLITLQEKDGFVFKPDSAVFTDIKRVEAAAREIVEIYREKNCSMSITGYAAPGVDKSTYLSKRSQIDNKNRNLTLARSKAFGEILKNLGFTDFSFGQGGTCPEWESTFGSDGAANESKQRACRRVEVSN